MKALVCQQVLTVHSQNNRHECEQKHSVIVTKALLLPLYWEGYAHLFLWTLGSAVYCGDCKTFCPTSRIRPVTSRPTTQFVQKRFIHSIIWYQR
jgi:hypothetical protein